MEFPGRLKSVSGASTKVLLFRASSSNSAPVSYFDRRYNRPARSRSSSSTGLYKSTHSVHRRAAGTFRAGNGSLPGAIAAESPQSHAKTASKVP